MDNQQLSTMDTESLIALLAKNWFPPGDRYLAGKKLAELGDPRPGAGMRQFNGQTIPFWEFSLIPAGEFWLGDNDGDQPQTLHNIPYDFWLSRYPVTVDQVHYFEEETGLKVEFLPGINPISNAPFFGLAWTHMRDFCEHYTIRGHKEGWLPKSLAITLPSEVEWEKSLRGGTKITTMPVTRCLGEISTQQSRYNLTDNPSPKRRYPWGDSVDIPHLKMDKTPQGKLDIVRHWARAPIGLFPERSSLYGITDIGFEATRTIWGVDETTPQYNYPYNPHDGRENLDASGFRVMRGEFNADHWAIRCSHRQPMSNGMTCCLRVAIVPVQHLHK